MKRCWDETEDHSREDDNDEDWSASINPHFPVDNSPLPITKRKSHATATGQLTSVRHVFEPHQPSHHSRTIVHIDLDCFYAQVEMIRNPQLRDKPLGIQQKNIVVTSNYVARERGVGKLMYVLEAKQKCPDLVLVSGEDLTHYRDFSQKVTDLLQNEFSPLVERLGFDENYVDVTSLVERTLEASADLEVKGHIYGSKGDCSCGCHRRLAIGSQIAARMRSRIKDELGLTGCAGVAWNKLLAKLVGEKNKPNDQTTLFPGSEQAMMIGLGNVRKIPGIGNSMNKKLATLDVVTVDDLQKISQQELEAQFGQQTACTLKNSSLGIDNMPVTKTGPPQSMSDEDSFKKCSSLSESKERMFTILQNLMPRLEKDGRVPQTIRLTVRQHTPTIKWHRESRQTNIPAYITEKMMKGTFSVTSPLMEILLNLFNKLVDTHKPFHLTLINICFANFQVKPSASKGLESYFAKSSESTTKDRTHHLRNNNIVEHNNLESRAKVRKSKSPMDKYLCKFAKKRSGVGNGLESHFTQEDSSRDVQEQENGNAQMHEGNDDMGYPRESPREESLNVESDKCPLRTDMKDSGPCTESSFFQGKCSARDMNNNGVDRPGLPLHHGEQHSSMAEDATQSRIPDHQVMMDEFGEGNSLERNSWKDTSIACNKENPLGNDSNSSPREGNNRHEYALVSEAIPLHSMNGSKDIGEIDESLSASEKSTLPPFTIPDGIDLAVFQSLPHEIREDLIREWKTKRSTPPSMKKQVKTANRKTPTSRSPASNSRITDFFRK